MRVSSVCAQVPTLGISGDCFHGIGFFQSGVPSTAAWPPPGPKTITSHLSRRLAAFLIVSGSM